MSTQISGKYHYKDFKIPKMPEVEQSPNAKKLLSPVKSYAKDKFKIYNS